MSYGGIEARPEATLLTDRAARYLANGPADVVDLIGHICNLPAAPRIVAEHMAQAMFAGRPEFVKDPLGRWTLTPVAPALDRGAGERPRGVWFEAATLAGPLPYGRSGQRRKSRGPAMPPQPLADLSFAVVDLETTGGQSPFDRITEVAAVIVERGEITKVYETLVNPQRAIPPFVSRLTRITWEMVRTAPTFETIAPELMETLQGHVFVAHNVAFDWKFLSREMTRAAGTRLVGRRLCTVRLARGLLPHLQRCSLGHLANYYGVEITRRHRAGGDAVATAHCLIRLLHDARGRGCTTWEDLDILLGARAPKKRRRKSALPSPVTKDTTA